MSEPPHESPQEPPQGPPQRPDGPGEPTWQPDPQWSQPPAGQQPPPGAQPYGGWPGGPYGYPQQRPAGAALAARLGVRLRIRPEPRFSVSLAAAGTVLAIFGALVWTIGYLADGLDIRFTSSGLSAAGEGRRFLGAGIAFVAAAVGYLILVRRKRGPVATAGAITAAFGVPIALAFLTLDIGGVLGGSFPINLDVVYLVTILIWLITYFAVPGGRGRVFFLGLALLTLPSYLEYKTTATSLLRTAEIGTVGGGGFNVGGLSTGGVTAIGLIFGLAYYAAAFVLDRRGLRGVAVAFVVAGFFTTASAVVASVDSLKQVGTGIELLILGAALSWYGARAGRRFTGWLWAAMIPVGIVVLVAKASPDNATAAGISLLVIGLIVVAVASVVAGATDEPADVDERGGDAGALPVGGFDGPGGYGGPGAFV